jgi:hypothetical protein
MDDKGTGNCTILNLKKSMIARRDATSLTALLDYTPARTYTINP